MKKEFLYLFLILAFVSCTDEVKFNNPTFEGQKDNMFWRAVDAKATIGSNGALMIEAFTRNEVVTLKTTSANSDTYFLGSSSLNSASYVLKDAAGTINFSTRSAVGEGEIEIEEFDAINKSVTGTFKFRAENIDSNPLAGPLLNFQYGRFYKVRITATLTTNLIAKP